MSKYWTIPGGNSVWIEAKEVAVFFFIVLGTRPIIRPGAEIVRRPCPNCGDWRNFQEVTWRNYFTLFFVPVFPLGPPRRGYACVSCGLTMSAEAAHAPAAIREEARPEGRWTGETLVVQCPRCDGRMRVPLRERGFVAICPHCTKEFRVKGERSAIPEAEIRED
mgnify:CR=1 FL=1